MDGIYIRITITILTMLSTGISALLGFADILPQWAKICLVVASAMIGVALNQIPSWQAAPKAERAMRRSGTE